tara:strand:- start:2475 stop:4658 length:2184 start_codon:yes stop_codon:yes gene_type:complete
MNEVMQRSMFRRNGSPRTGERVSSLQTLLQDIRDTEKLRSTVGDAESDNIQRQLGNLLKVPFEEFQGKYVRNPKTGDFEPMSGPLTGTVVRENEMMLNPNVETIFVIDRREGSETFGMEIPVPRNMETYEMIRSGMFEFDEITNMADGGEMKSDAVGIADGLDQETPKTDPNTEGVAKVSPEKYVQLMNEVRGDEVPLEGRVQELATKVGEKDAQDTPLSVLALVQPVFELEEQGGVAQTQQAQQMMQQAPVRMNKGGIVHASKGLFADVQNLVGPGATSFLQSLQDYYNISDKPFDLQASKQSYVDLLTDKAKQRGDLYSKATMPLFAFAQAALDPTKTTSDVVLTGLGGISKFGQDVQKGKDKISNQALALALEDRKTAEKQKADYGNFIASSMKDIVFMDPIQRELKRFELDNAFIENKMKNIDLANYEDLKGVEYDKLMEDLNAVKLSNQKAMIGLKYEDEEQFNNLNKQKLDIETAQQTLNAKRNEQFVVDNVKTSLLTNPDITLSAEDEAMIRLDPLKWLEKNKDKTGVGELDKLKVQIEKDLRKEYEDGSDLYKKATDNIGVVRGAVAQEQTNAGDIALIYAYMKMLDPTSTVMQGEYATVQNAGTIPQTIISQYNKLLTEEDGFLEGKIRKDFVRRAETLYDQRVKQHNKFTTAFEDIVDTYKTYNVDPEAIFIDFGIVSEPQPEFKPYDSGGMYKDTTGTGGYDWNSINQNNPRSIGN